MAADRADVERCCGHALFQKCVARMDTHGERVATMQQEVDPGTYSPPKTHAREYDDFASVTTCRNMVFHVVLAESCKCNIE